MATSTGFTGRRPLPWLAYLYIMYRGSNPTFVFLNKNSSPFWTFSAHDNFLDQLILDWTITVTGKADACQFTVSPACHSTVVVQSNIDFIYPYTFFEITKFSKILSKLTFFSKNFENFVKFRKYIYIIIVLRKWEFWLLDRKSMKFW